MKSTSLTIVFSIIIGVATFGQDVPPRGPYNTLKGGITDGVVIKDEVPIRSAVHMSMCAMLIMFGPKEYSLGLMLEKN